MEQVSFKNYMIAAISVMLCIIVIMVVNQKHELNTAKIEQDVSRYKVGIILDSGADDGGWNQAHYEGMKKAADSLGLDIEYREYVADDEVARVGEEMIAAGCKEIFGTSFNYGPAMLQLADKHPDIYFFHCSGNKKAANLSTYFGRMYQARYLAGIVAGMSTKTNSIGYVAAIPIAEVIRGINAFTIGVRQVNPNAVVHVRWSNSWDAPDLEKQLTDKLVDEAGVDIVTYHQNGDSSLFEAETKGIKGIGYHYDRGQQHPYSMITAAVWDWANLYNRVMRDCIDGKFRSQAYLDSLESYTVGIAAVKNSPNDLAIKQAVNKARYKISEGSWDVFYGPIYDQFGVLRVQPGETLSDLYLFGKLNWFVQGVEGVIPVAE